MTTEREIQTAVMNYLAGRERVTRELVAFHVPNGGSRHPREAANLKRQGVRPGVPDIIVALRDGRTLWIELKAKRGRVSPAQEAFGEGLKALGHEYYVIAAETPGHAVTRVAQLIEGRSA